MPHDLLNFLVHQNNLDDRDAAFVADAAALGASLRYPHRVAVLRELLRVRDVVEEQVHQFFLVADERLRFAAVRTQAPH